MYKTFTKIKVQTIIAFKWLIVFNYSMCVNPVNVLMQ